MFRSVVKASVTPARGAAVLRLSSRTSRQMQTAHCSHLRRAPEPKMATHEIALFGQLGHVGSGGMMGSDTRTTGSMGPSVQKSKTLSAPALDEPPY